VTLSKLGNFLASPFKKNVSIHMKCSMTGQAKGDPLMQVAA
jgi:uncharacterized protein involved in cysteine biosynthesis